jgi:catechol 2,3-dioxygenase-like lactoylglutathione lyase family enzyme
MTALTDIDIGGAMSRVQLALRVADLDAAVEFYSKLFDVPVAKRRPGYANFAIPEPPLKLVLLEGAPGNPTALDHLGVEVGDTASVMAAAERLSSSGLETGVESGATCCYAVQDKVWVTGPGDEPWEVYTVLADDRPDLEGVTDLALSAISGDRGCCASDGEGRSNCC